MSKYIKSELLSVSDFTKKILDTRELDIVIEQLNTADAVIYPPPELIFNAFKLCPVEKTKVVIIGQDPYCHPGEANGLCFSVPKTVKIPTSLKNIYKCLQTCGLINEIPAHGDLSYWAKQGVLLINSALTTEASRAGSHMTLWRKYTDEIISAISNFNPVFILLGNHAIGKTDVINPRSKIFTWGHPSPINPKNQRENPEHFKYSDVFTKTNAALTSAGVTPIQWNPDLYIVSDIAADVWRDVGDMDPMPPSGELWVFTDGAATANGKANCKASWAFYITDGTVCMSRAGLVTGEKSNNRGELTGILEALTHIDTAGATGNINIVSDSMYSISAIDKWYDNWVVTSKIPAKKNIDIIEPCVKLIRKLRQRFTVNFRHVKSHTDAPTDDTSPEWFYWKCNDIVDKLCTELL